MEYIENNMSMTNKTSRYWQLNIICTIYIAYAAYYLSRKSFTYIAPFLVHDLSITKIDIGIISSVFSMLYGISKFVSGILCDYFNSRYFLAIGLIATGLCNIACGYSYSLLLFVILSALNGWFQGFGWPACTHLLTNYFDTRERGKWWGICSTAHAVGGCIISYLAVYCAENYSWQYGMVIPGILCIIIGMWIINRFKDIPSPTVVVFCNDQDHSYTLINKKNVEEIQITFTIKQIYIEYLLCKRYIWLLALSYFFTYIIRSAISDWLTLFLVEVKGYEISNTVICVILFEIGSFLGIISAGWGSDYLLNGKRIPLAILSFFMMFFFIIILWYLPSRQFIINCVVIQVIGALVFCPQMLIGLAAAELVVKRIASTANGFVGFFGYIGSALAGYPLGIVIELYGWYNFIILLLISCIICILALLGCVKEISEAI